MNLALALTARYLDRSTSARLTPRNEEADSDRHVQRARAGAPVFVAARLIRQSPAQYEPHPRRPYWDALTGLDRHER